MYGRAFGTFPMHLDGTTTNHDEKISLNALCMRNVPKARPYMAAYFSARFHLPTF